MNAQAGAVSGWPGATAVSAVPSVVVLCAGNRNRQVTSAVDPPELLDRPPPLIAVGDDPDGSSWRTVVSRGELPTLRTWIWYRGAGLRSVATATVTGGGGADAGTRDGGATAGGADGGVGSALARAATATAGGAGLTVADGVTAAGPGAGVVVVAGGTGVAGRGVAAAGRGAAAASGAAAGRAGTAARMPRQCTNTARALWCRVDAGIRTNLRSRR
ncbi:hypothetical protein GCM10009848_09220 [Micromonospora lupini]